MCPQSNLIYVISQLRLSFQMNLGCIRLVVNAKILCMCVCVAVCVCLCVEYVMCVCIRFSASICTCRRQSLIYGVFLCYYTSFCSFYSDESLTLEQSDLMLIGQQALDTLQFVPLHISHRCRMTCLPFYFSTCNPNSGHPAVQHISLLFIPKIEFECLFSSWWHSLGDCEIFRSWNLAGRSGALEVFASFSPALIALYFLELAPRILLWLSWW